MILYGIHKEILLDFQQLLLPSNDNENDREFIGEKLMKNLQTLSITNYIPFDVSNWKNLTRLKILRINNPQILKLVVDFQIVYKV